MVSEYAEPICSFGGEIGWLPILEYIAQRP